MPVFGFEKLNKKEYLGLSSFQFLAFFRRLLIYTFLVIYLGDEIGLNNFEVSLMATLPMISSVISQSLIWGPLLDKYPKPTNYITIGEIIAGAGHVALFLVHKQYLDLGELRSSGFAIIFVLAIIEFFWSMSNVSWNALIAQKSSSQERTQIMAQLSVIGGIGGIVGSQVAAVFYKDGLGFANGTIFYIASAIMVSSGFLLFLLFQIDRNGAEDIVTNAKDHDRFTRKFSSLDYKLRKNYLVFILATVFIFFGVNSITLLQNLYIREEGGFDVSDSQVALKANLASLSSLLAGIMISIKLKNVKDTKLLTYSVLLAIVSLIWMGIAPSFLLFLISISLLGFVFVFLQSTGYSIVARLIPEDFYGRMFAYWNVAFFLSWGLGFSLFTGPLADFLINRGSSPVDAYKATFFAAAAIMLAGLLVLRYFIEINGSYQDRQLSDSKNIVVPNIISD